MKKLIQIMVVFIVFSFSLTAVANEETSKNYFGVGAIVEESENFYTVNTHTVKTKGESTDEGFVHSPKILNKDSEFDFQIYLKGKGLVYLKIEETDSKGKFIKEKRSPEFQLTDEWKSYNLKTNLNQNTSQVDVFVLTGTKEKTEFEFRIQK